MFLAQPLALACYDTRLIVAIPDNLTSAQHSSHQPTQCLTLQQLLVSAQLDAAVCCTGRLWAKEVLAATDFAPDCCTEALHVKSCCGVSSASSVMHFYM